MRRRVYQKYSRAAGPWAFSLGDFIGFHQQTGKSLLLVLSQADMDAAREKYRGHRFDEPILREDEQPYTVHSTPWKTGCGSGMTAA